MATKSTKSSKSSKKAPFRKDDYIVYPAHGVGRITSIEEQEIAGAPGRSSNCLLCLSRKTK